MKARLTLLREQLHAEDYPPEFIEFVEISMGLCDAIEVLLKHVATLQKEIDLLNSQLRKKSDPKQGN